jgi:hypothetical protein
VYKDAKGRYEYPPDHIGRKSYVTVQGFDHSIPKPYCFYHGGRWYLQGTSVEGDVAPAIMSDISEYWSPLSGQMVTSRSQRRNEIRAYGVLEVGNEPMRPFQPVEMSRPGHDIVRAMRR